MWLRVCLRIKSSGLYRLVDCFLNLLKAHIDLCSLSQLLIVFVNWVGFVLSILKGKCLFAGAAEIALA